MPDLPEPPAPSTDGPVAAAADDGPTGARRHPDRVVSLLERVVPVARGTRLVVTGLAIVAGAVVIGGALVILTVGTDPGAVGVLGALALVVVLLVPSLLLLGLRFLLTTVVELPDRLRREPGLRKDQAGELADLAVGRDPGGAGSLPPHRRVWRAARLLVSARGELLEYALVLRLFSWPYLVVSSLAAVAAVAEILILPLVVAVVLVT